MTATPFQSLTLSDLESMSFPPVEWIIDGVLPAGALALLVGRPKAGKSLLTLDMLASVALGETYIDRATAQGPAIYFPAEDALRMVRSRLFTRIGSERTAPIHVVPADGSLDQSIRLDDPESFIRLAATIEAVRPSLVVLDPFREFHHRKENDADDMAAVLRPLRNLAHQTDTAVVLVHHRNKHASDPALATRGSSAITGGVDVVMTCELSNESDEDELTPDQTLTIRVEGRYGPRMKLGARLRTGLRWEPATPRMADDLNAGDKVLRHLEVAGGAFTADELVTETGMATRTIQNALPALVKGGRIVRQGSGKKGEPYRYQLTVWQSRNGVGEHSGEHPAAYTSQKRHFLPDSTGYTPQSGGIISGNGNQRFCPLCEKHGVRSLIPLATMDYCQLCTEQLEQKEAS